MYFIIDLIFQILYLCMIARIVLSWIPHNPANEIIQWVYRISEPILAPFRQLLPPTSSGFDFSPILAFIALGIARKFIFWIMY